LPNGRLVFLPTPAKQDDGRIIIAEIESASGKTPLAVRVASHGELGKAGDRMLPKTCPDTSIWVEAWMYAIAKDAPVKALMLPVLAARDLVGPPRGALTHPGFDLRPGRPGSWHRDEKNREQMEVTASVTPDGVHVEGTLTVPILEGKYETAAEALRRAEAEKEPGTARSELRASFSATLGTNDALVFPVASEGHFPETLVSCLTAFPRRVARDRWQPASTRSPVLFDGWVLTWPRSEHEWFTSLYDYKSDPAKISRILKHRKDTSAKYLTSEWVGFMGDAELKTLVEAFRQRPGVKAVRIEPFSIPQHHSSFSRTEDWAHFSAAGEGGRMLVRTNGTSISPSMLWDAPLLKHVSSAPSIGVESGKCFSILLPGPADPEEIRMMILRCVNPDVALVPEPER
jgi:hypothetical protein